ncbi:MAG: leucyl aminopeptidase, partial [Acidobacteria bacterium]|nr:leucyl aminopeptidase [Acidobacteriota bacterium]
MNVEISRNPKLAKIDHLFLLLAEKPREAELPEAFAESVRKSIVDARFEGRSDESITILNGEPRKVTLIGIGKADAISLRGVRAALYGVAKLAKRNRDAHIAVHLPYLLKGLDANQTARLLADYLAAADYKYDAYHTQKKDEKKIAVDAVLIPHGEVDIKRIQGDARALADGIKTVRDLGNGPGNLVTPTHIADRATEVAESVGVKITVHDKKGIEKLKMGGLLAVNRGSAQEPRFVVLEYAPKKAKKHVALVGKGITFDSGGISIKPSENMHEMKYDMSGGAGVIAALTAIAQLKPKLNVLGLVPSSENLPGPRAVKPGDILRSMSGKTIEVINTDAEGRLILADALSYA